MRLFYCWCITLLVNKEIIVIDQYTLYFTGTDIKNLYNFYSHEQPHHTLFPE